MGCLYATNAYSYLCCGQLIRVDSQLPADMMGSGRDFTRRRPRKNAGTMRLDVSHGCLKPQVLGDPLFRQFQFVMPSEKNRDDGAESEAGGISPYAEKVRLRHVECFEREPLDFLHKVDLVRHQGQKKRPCTLTRCTHIRYMKHRAPPETKGILCDTDKMATS